MKTTRVKPWHYGVLVLLALWLIGTMMGANDGVSASPTEEPWFSGGTLHQASIEEWKAAAPRNKLATAADWTVVAIGAEKLKTQADFDALRTLASEVVTCMDTALADTEMTGGAADLAVMCMTIMGYTK